MAEITKIAWCDGSFNPWLGCQHWSHECDHCLDPNTPVVVEGFYERPIGMLRPGDRVLAFDEHGDRTYQLATVQKVWRTTKPAVRVRTERHHFVASLDHRFLAGDDRRPRWIRIGDAQVWQTSLRALPVDMPSSKDTSSEGYRAGYIQGATEGDGTLRYPNGRYRDQQWYWRVAVLESDGALLDRLQSYLASFDLHLPMQRFFHNDDVGRAMVCVETRERAKVERFREWAEMEESYPADYSRGWLAGLFDTDGNWSRPADGRRPNALRIANTVAERLAAVVHHGERLGYEFKIEKYSRNCSTARLMGGLPVTQAFVGDVQPALVRKTEAAFGSQFGWKPERVLGLEYLGERELVDIETSSGTFVAASLMTHNCYADALTSGRMGLNVFGGRSKRKRTAPRTWANAETWNRHSPAKYGRPTRVFCASLADVFEDAPGPNEWRSDLWELVHRTPWLDWLILTKRPENIEKMLPNSWGDNQWGFWPNVWLGTSIGFNDTAFRSPILTAVPALVHFISYEPALGPGDRIPLEHLEWVIYGGESGPDHRRHDITWAYDMWARCERAGIAFFFKQGNGPRSDMHIDELGQVVREFPVSWDRRELLRAAAS